MLFTSAFRCTPSKANYAIEDQAAQTKVLRGLAITFEKNPDCSHLGSVAGKSVTEECPCKYVIDDTVSPQSSISRVSHCAKLQRQICAVQMKFLAPRRTNTDRAL